MKEEYRTYFVDYFNKAEEAVRVSVLTDDEKEAELKKAVDEAAVVATAAGTVALLPDGQECPDNEVRFANSTQILVQSNVLKESDQEALRKVCSTYRKGILTVFVHLRGDRTEIELYSLTNLMKACANEEHFTAILLLPLGFDALKKRVEKVMSTMGKVSNLYLSNLDPFLAKQFGPGIPGEFQTAPIQCIRHAVVVHFSASNEALSTVKGCHELLSFPNLALNQQYSYAGDSESNDSHAIKDPDQLNPTMVEHIW